MTYKQLLLLASAACVALIGCAKKLTLAVPDADIVVAQDGSGNHTTISSALDEADEGYVIYVKQGTYRGGVEIKEPGGIVLVGAGPGVAIIDAGGDYAALTIDADDCEVSGFTLRDASSHGIYIKDGSHKIHHCLVTGNGDRGIYFTSFGGSPSAVVDHCTVTDNEVSGIYSPEDNEDTEVTNCIVAFTGRGIVTDENEGGIKVEYNCLHNNGTDLDRVSEGEGNIFEDPEFTDLDSGDYTLKASSPCLGAASDGANMGCF
ncbi:MAG: right-handed parallel beta-helix repeat-containing protein [candidate division WOR-3 bacterium]|nr:MAG: right-handed parallel beta-helix repeat-containing protein [candidate division WOR-3 bacterium]